MTDIDLSRYFRLFFKWSWLIVLAAVLAAGVSYKVSKRMPRVYRADMTLMVGDTAADPNVNADQIATSVRLAATYAQMLQQEPVLSATVQALHLPGDWTVLRPRVLVAHADLSQFIQVYVVDTDPHRAKAVSDEIARQLVLHSPTQQNIDQLQQHNQFVQGQLDELQKEIQQAQGQLDQKQAELNKSDSARAVLDDQDQVQALQLKIADWRKTYASLLNASQTKPANTITVVDAASVPWSAVSPNVRMNVMLAALLAVVLSAGSVLLIGYFSDTLESTGEAQRLLDLPALGAIQRSGKGRLSPESLVSAANPYSAVAEAYRVCRTNILMACVEPQRQAEWQPLLLMVTSPMPGEGKTFTSANLAHSFAQMGKSVILADIDLRHSMLHELFAAPNEVGLTTLYLEDDDSALASFHDLVKERVRRSLLPTGIPGLHLLPAGPSAPNPAELLSLPFTEEILKALGELADVVILDSPPVLPVADAAILSAKGIATMLVVEAGKTRRSQAYAAHEVLRHARANVLGVVLNKARHGSNAYGAHKYPGQGPSGGTSPLRGLRSLVHGR